MTNKLRLCTRGTADERVFEVRWATGLEAKGIVHVRTAAEEDGKVVAELAAARWLLEDRNACGHDKTGSGLEITFSTGACKRLANGESAKENLVRYAHFLRTRFHGATLDVETRIRDWMAFEAAPMQLDAQRCDWEQLEMRGYGPVELTAHAIEKYVERIPGKAIKAYREIRRLMMDPNLKEIRFEGRRGMSDIAHKLPGRYFYYEPKNVVFVVTKAPSAKAARMVTVLAPDSLARTRITSVHESECPA